MLQAVEEEQLHEAPQAEATHAPIKPVRSHQTVAK
jgi:hypothetical protein